MVESPFRLSVPVPEKAETQAPPEKVVVPLPPNEETPAMPEVLVKFTKESLFTAASTCTPNLVKFNVPPRTSMGSDKFME